MYRILSVSGQSNEVVTDYYLEIIKEAIETTGNEVNYFTAEEKPEKNQIIIVATILDALKYWIRGYKKIMLWVQGVEPEESFMRNMSKFRFFVLSLIEKFVLRKAMYLFLVSTEMKRHYEKKYKLKLDHKSYIMPCFNTELNTCSFFFDNKYRTNVFTYVGSVAKWQCFEETVKLYSDIERMLKGKCELRLYVKDRSYAENMLRKYNVRNFEIKYVSKEALDNEMSSVKFGFILRKEDLVNTVSTPTKMSTYLSNGVIPIYSSSIKEFGKVFGDCNYMMRLEKNNLQEMDTNLFEPLDAENIYREYSNIFQSYYNRDKYVCDIAGSLRRLMS